MERKLLGQVGVDSGQLVIIDPRYIESEWKRTGSILGVDYWGQAQEKIYRLLKDDGIESEKLGGKYRVMTEEAETLIKKIEFLAKDMKQLNKNIDGWGKRIVKVEIELVDDEYLQKINEHFGIK
ncbi:hypothetical protein [Brevibacillus parabrevis]|uniref:Uncharacterized protein n=1 Tax=Brevibacillus parabrevis TaxID=54914 RepID=A0A4Y3PE22_BREPA|nr:hypothetical protein [Brevibacillus parabrevis]RNB93687.1 hypothetical protein EDM60_21860 [Brevibacillus parabrevis]GEB31637.1 hypothetical protein BPA01_12170 [Brevibacillus parabrevis]